MGNIEAIRHKVRETIWNKGAASHRARPEWGKRAVIAQVTGALARAFLVLVLVATPSLLLPTISSDASQIVALVAISAAALTLFEYMAVYPGLVEFRDAPPFNRIRFGALFVTVFLLSATCLAEIQPNTTTEFVQAIAVIVGQVLNFPYSPVHLFSLMPASDISADQHQLILAVAGLAYFLSILSVCLFFMVVRVQRWPMNNGTFNVWVNLPTFDPTAGVDVVARLQRAAWVNTSLGFLLPFLFPAAVTASMVFSGPLRLEDPQTLIWMATGWALLPSSLIMRGIALFRIASLIAQARRDAGHEDDGSLQPA